MHAWYKLTTRDMGPVTRCIGPWVPPAQDFQYPLPAPSTKTTINYDDVKQDIIVAMTNASASLVPDMKDGIPYYGDVFAYVAYQCASTFRKTDYQGGCNGARIRFSPEKDWPSNAAGGTVDGVLGVLQPVKDKYGDELSWADLIVLAGTTGVAMAIDQQDNNNGPVNFCGGRTDATDGSGSTYLQPNDDTTMRTAWDLRNKAKMLGLSDREMVVLSALPLSPQQGQRLGYSGTVTSAPGKWSGKEYFHRLLKNDWEPVDNNASAVSNASKDMGAPADMVRQYKAKGKEGDDLYITYTDFIIRSDPDLAAIAQDYARKDDETFNKDFMAAWTKIMNNDRFDGPSGNVCASNQ